MDKVKRSEVLSLSEIQGATWAKVLAYLNQRLESKRVENDNTKTAKETEKLRGRIAEIKNLIALGQPELQYETQEGFD